MWRTFTTILKLLKRSAAEVFKAGGRWKVNSLNYRLFLLSLPSCEMWHGMNVTEEIRGGPTNLSLVCSSWSEITTGSAAEVATLEVGPPPPPTTSWWMPRWPDRATTVGLRLSWAVRVKALTTRWAGNTQSCTADFLIKIKCNDLTREQGNWELSRVRFCHRRSRSYVTHSTPWSSMARQPCSCGCSSRALYFTTWRPSPTPGAPRTRRNFTSRGGVSVIGWILKLPLDNNRIEFFMNAVCEFYMSAVCEFYISAVCIRIHKLTVQLSKSSLPQD